MRTPYGPVILKPDAEIPSTASSAPCSGTCDADTRIAFARFLPRGSGDIENPWEASGSPSQCTPMDSEFDFGNITLPSGDEFTCYVWVVRADQSGFVRSPKDFARQMGSGGSGPCLPVGRSDHAALAPEAVPRVYRVRVDVSTLGLGTLGAGFLAEGLLESSSLYLTYDERESTGDAHVWAGQNMADACGFWVLRVNPDPCPEGRLELRQLSKRSVSRPITWMSQFWSYQSVTRFTSCRGNSPSITYPDVLIEPA